MNVPEIRGPGNLHPGREGKAGKAPKGAPSPGGALESPDTISISPESSRQAVEMEMLVERARSSDPERLEALSGVRERLDAGELNRPEVFRKTAERILSGE